MINNAYTANTKLNGQVLSADDWNAISSAVATAHTEINDILTNAQTPIESNNVVSVTAADENTANVSIASGVQNVGSPNVIQLTKKSKGVNTTVLSGNNINIEPREALGTGADKSGDNMKGGNIALKPGDDIELWAHHRGSSKNDEVSVKIMTEVPKISDPTKTDEVAAKLQLNAADIVLRSDDKTSDSDEMNITVNKGKDTRGYLKVRAQAIDLRCEDHGGIALQPKGEDPDHNENKIKFEHGGGDGLEFGTFNTEKTSLFTKEYRFNKDGKILLATRTTQASDRADANDPTTTYKYVKLADDFYDVIYEGEIGNEFYTYDPTDTSDTSVTWGDVVEFIAWAKANGLGPFASQTNL